MKSSIFIIEKTLLSTFFALAATIYKKSTRNKKQIKLSELTHLLAAEVFRYLNPIKSYSQLKSSPNFLTTLY
uniref:Putative secreted protein n=1 Tax=Lutzomyia longipalpis TaxID=7200 RepID=A0A7G3ANP4_LUTLO